MGVRRLRLLIKMKPNIERATTAIPPKTPPIIAPVDVSESSFEEFKSVAAGGESVTVDTEDVVAVEGDMVLLLELNGVGKSCRARTVFWSLQPHAVRVELAPVFSDSN